MLAPMGIFGTCDERFAAARVAFERNFATGAELGASFAVVHDDELVVDLWGGWADVDRTRPWGRDTIVSVASTSKVAVTIVGLMLLDRRLIELDEPIASYWPEFAAAGKADIPVRQIFCHETGVAGFDPPTSIETILGDWDTSVAQLAAQEPWWEPGTASGYHGMTYGYLIGELVRRTTHRPYDEFLRTELTEPLAADFSIGVPERDRARVADVESRERRVFPNGPGSLAARVDHPLDARMVGPMPTGWLTGCNPGAVGFTNARAVATLGAVLANSGTSRGRRFLSEESVALTAQEQRYEYDLVMEDRVRWGLGFALAGDEVPLPFPRSVHWGGYGGSTFVADPDSRTTWAYTPNRFVPDRGGDARGSALGGATVRSILSLD
jgi:CubicO group peptidase (beta-lactamase class C family)